MLWGRVPRWWGRACAVRGEIWTSGHWCQHAVPPDRDRGTVQCRFARSIGRSLSRSSVYAARRGRPAWSIENKGPNNPKQIPYLFTMLRLFRASLHTFLIFRPSRPPAKHRRVWRESKIMSSQLLRSGTCQAYPVYTSGAQEDVSTAVHGSQEKANCVPKCMASCGSPPNESRIKRRAERDPSASAIGVGAHRGLGCSEFIPLQLACSDFYCYWSGFLGLRSN